MRSLSQVCLTESSDTQRKMSIKIKIPQRFKSEIIQQVPSPKTNHHFSRYSQCFFPTQYEIEVPIKKSSSVPNKITLSKGSCTYVDGKIRFERLQFPKIQLPKPKPLDIKQEISNWLKQSKESPKKKRIVFRAIKKPPQQSNYISLI